MDSKLKNKFPWAVYAVDVVMGSIIGPANFFAFMAYVGQNSIDPLKDPNIKKIPFSQILTGSMSTLFNSKDFLLTFILPCALSTAVLAPFFLRRLELIKIHPPRACILKSAFAGIIFGLIATFATLLFMFTGAILFGDGSLRLLPGVPIFAALTGILFNIALAPAILISGAIFGILNRYLLRL